jgi:hypothetical protein
MAISLSVLALGFIGFTYDILCTKDVDDTNDFAITFS